MRYDAGMSTASEQVISTIKRTGLLGGLSPRSFLRDYWHKQPLLIRAAVPGFTGILSADELAGLACEEDVQSRLVICQRGRWQVESGPFTESRFARLPRKNWTLLVQGVNEQLAAAAALLQQFDFIPYARLDDLMVSYAPDGGGVGPHYDSYDVFLLQGSGRRLWRTSQQSDLTLVDGAPLKILRHFQTEHEYLLEPGDMLYLPPQVAHWGIAVGECMTYSIGFRAPSAQELATQFLLYLQENIALEGRYADPDLKLPQHPARIGDSMVRQVVAMLRGIRWDQSVVGNFLGSYLTEPKMHVVFDTPPRLAQETFRKCLQQHGLQLALKTQMLFYQDSFFINGERVEADPAWIPCLRQLADQRQLLPQAFIPSVLADQRLLVLLHEWYLAGYVKIMGKT